MQLSTFVEVIKLLFEIMVTKVFWPIGGESIEKEKQFSETKGLHWNIYISSVQDKSQVATRSNILPTFTLNLSS